MRARIVPRGGRGSSAWKSVIFILTTFITFNLYLKKGIESKSLFRTKGHGEHGTRRWTTLLVRAALCEIDRVWVLWVC